MIIATVKALFDPEPGIRFLRRLREVLRLYLEYISDFKLFKFRLHE